MLKALVGAAYNFTREAWMDNNNDTIVEKIPMANKKHTVRRSGEVE